MPTKAPETNNGLVHAARRLATRTQTARVDPRPDAQRTCPLLGRAPNSQGWGPEHQRPSRFGTCSFSRSFYLDLALCSALQVSFPGSQQKKRERPEWESQLQDRHTMAEAPSHAAGPTIPHACHARFFVSSTSVVLSR